MMLGWWKYTFVTLLLLIAPTSRSMGQIRDDQAALKTLKVPEGFEIRLFAGSDICHNPTSIDVDIYGRVWVAEGVNYRSTLNKGPGPLDPVSGAHLAARYRELIAGADIVSLPGIGHYPQIEAPQAVLDAFFAFHRQPA